MDAHCIEPAAMSVTGPLGVLDGAPDAPGADAASDGPAVGEARGPVRVAPGVGVALAVELGRDMPMTSAASPMITRPPTIPSTSAVWVRMGLVRVVGPEIS